MIPVFTIIGRPNVGKSTLFNALTRSKDALVADFPGVTRDRQYGQGVVGDKPYIIVDTGGIVETDDSDLAHLTEAQVKQAIEEADRLLFMVDGKVGLTAADQEIAAMLRSRPDKVTLLVNKADRGDAALICSDFYQLGMGEPIAISAKSGRGIKEFIQKLSAAFPEVEAPTQEQGIRVAVVGRPNTGKSTLINRILGEERVVVFDQPGTTRDSIDIPFEYRGMKYTLIDTAGIRRRAKVSEAIEKFSIIKTLQAMQSAHIVLVLLNAQEDISEQDLRLIGKALEMGKGLIIAINKWDGLTEDQREKIKQQVDRRFSFVDFARRYYISALHGSGVGKLYHAINEAYHSATLDISTSQLTTALQQAILDHQPPLVHGRRIRLRYAHLGGRHPLTVIIHGKQTEDLPQSYQRYLAHYFRERFKLVGVPILIRMRSDVNPYVE